MKLLEFRVTDFRSVKDSGWIEADRITALIGTNESGKTNLLIPLWKLKPAKDGELNAIADYPRKRYNEIRSLAPEKKPIFITAHFELEAPLITQLMTLTGANADDVSIASVARRFDGMYIITFPNAKSAESSLDAEIQSLLSAAKTEIETLTTSVKADQAIKDEMTAALEAALSQCGQAETIGKATLEKIKVGLDAVNLESAAKRSVVVPRYEQLVEDVGAHIQRMSRPLPGNSAEARQLVLKNVPAFVYYSNYGNLDSEIYLPHVIQNMERDDLGSREEAKVRTMKVLFEFVRLQPQEILELGAEPEAVKGSPTEEEIKVNAESKKEREILLQSASTELTGKFRDWWKQGEYRIRFNADGNHFRIWVSDDRRPEEIELEGRSTGLQWFLSFYLIFLVESADSHQGAILLLDEPGLSLHPLAQRDLSEFFENLSNTNQLLYTTHSPFLVDPNHLDRVKAVFVNDEGTTSVSANLREGLSREEQSKSVYPVHAALGLSVSDVLLQGCQPVIVEGPSDQIYLSAIKNYLIAGGHLTPKREIVFVPAGGVKGVGAVASILTAKDERLPFVICDSDSPGQDLAKKLKTGLYQGQAERIAMVGEELGLENAEVEDLMPFEFMAGVVTRFLRGTEGEFIDVAEEGKTLVSQIEAFAQKEEVSLEQGWKVDLARRAKEAFVKRDIMKDQTDLLEVWKKVFSNINS